MRYSEQQLTSEALDQKPFHGKPTKIFICSTPRSGSYMLCRYMVNAGLGVPHEYFNPIIMRQMGPRLGLHQAQKLNWRPRSPWDYLPPGRTARSKEIKFLRQYLDSLIPQRCLNGAFAAKMHFDHYLKVLDNPVGHELLDGGLFVHLYREDLLAQAVSTHFANLTGQWSIDGVVTTAPVPNPDFFDATAIRKTLKELADCDRGWRLFFGHNGVSAISISYEKLCTDPFGAVAHIASHAGVDSILLRRGYSEVGALEERNHKLPKKHDVIRQYLDRFGKISSVGRRDNEVEAVLPHFDCQTLRTNG